MSECSSLEPLYSDAAIICKHPYYTLQYMRFPYEDLRCVCR